MNWFKKRRRNSLPAPRGVLMWHSGAEANVEVLGPIVAVRHKGHEYMSIQAYLSPAREDAS